MIYPYFCINCNSNHDITKPHDLASKEESCPNCGNILKRIFTVPFFSLNNSTYSIALGTETSTSNLSILKKQYQDRTGSEMVEADAKPKRNQKKSIPYELPREVMQQIENN
jgi:predicted nucleic acid-binding Zn ribbon protein